MSRIRVLCTNCHRHYDEGSPEDGGCDFCRVARLSFEIVEEEIDLAVLAKKSATQLSRLVGRLNDRLDSEYGASEELVDSITKAGRSIAHLVDSARKLEDDNALAAGRLTKGDKAQAICDYIRCLSARDRRDLGMAITRVINEADDAGRVGKVLSLQGGKEQ